MKLRVISHQGTKSTKTAAGDTTVAGCYHQNRKEETLSVCSYPQGRGTMENSSVQCYLQEITWLSNVGKIGKYLLKHL